MAENDTKALMPKGKQEIVSKAEQTKDGLVFTPMEGRFQCGLLETH